MKQANTQEIKAEWLNVHVGSGRKVHRMLKGSSTTNCGYWIGTHSIWQVNTPCTCEKCDVD